MRVYVVGFAPANDSAAIGGFDWFPSPGEAVARARRDLREIGGLGNHSVTYVPLDVPNDVAYPDDQTVADRDAVTAWIDANLHLVEVGLDPTPDSNDGDREDISYKVEPVATCIVYECGEPADGEGTIAFALPGGAEVEAHVCAGHRAVLTANTLRGVSMAEPTDDLQRDESLVREGVALGRAIEERRQTRPSAIVRRPDPETPISETTVAELLTEAMERGRAKRGDRRGAASGREFSIFVTLLEDAITRHNKGVYMERGVFAITDAERIPPADGESE